MREFIDNYFNIKKIIRSKREYRQQMARVEALPEDCDAGLQEKSRMME